ncbi:hypothetical protein MKC90_17990 [[Clostridium] innocuum]|nr:hypothetical protein [[Clostridium] innocuum]
MEKEVSFSYSRQRLAVVYGTHKSLRMSCISAVKGKADPHLLCICTALKSSVLNPERVSYSVLFTQLLSCEKSLFFNLLFYSQKVRNCWNANT